MGSRVHTVGNIVTRTKDLVNAGVLKSRPVWLDALESHPPLTPMAVNAACVPGRPPRINYRKDLLMKDFYERYKDVKETVSLFEDHSEQNVAEKFVSHQLTLIGDAWITKELKEETSLATKEFIEKEYRLQLIPNSKEVNFIEEVELTEEAKKLHDELFHMTINDNEYN